MEDLRRQRNAAASAVNSIHNVECGLSINEPVEGLIVDGKITFDRKALRIEALRLCAALPQEFRRSLSIINPAQQFFFFLPVK